MGGYLSGWGVTAERRVSVGVEVTLDGRVSVGVGVTADGRVFYLAPHLQVEELSITIH